MDDKIIVISGELFTVKELKHYEQHILDNKHITELDISLFFKEFPKFLSIGGYKQIVREVVLYKADDKPTYRVDFFRKKYGEDFWDIVELKSPSASFVVQSGKHWKFSSIIEAGINQAMDYKNMLDDELNRIKLEEQSGIKSFKPDILLIGGRDNKQIDSIELRKLRDRYKTTDIKTYDDLYNFACDNYKTNIYAIPVFSTFASSKNKINERGNVHIESENNKKEVMQSFSKWIPNFLFDPSSRLKILAETNQKIKIYVRYCSPSKIINEYLFEINYEQFEKIVDNIQLEKSLEKVKLTLLCVHDIDFIMDYKQAERITSELGGKEKALRYSEMSEAEEQKLNR